MSGMLVRKLHRTPPGALYIDTGTRPANGAPGSPWVHKATAGQPAIINNQFGVTTTTNGFYEIVYNMPPETPDHFAEFRISTMNTANTPIALMLGCAASGSNVHVCMFINSSQVGIYSATAWGGGSLTARANYTSSGTKVVGDRFQFYRVGKIYYAAKNGNVVTSWNDSSSIAPLANIRSGLALQRSSGSISSYVNEFRCGDYSRLLTG